VECEHCATFLPIFGVLALRGAGAGGVGSRRASSGSDSEAHSRVKNFARDPRFFSQVES